MITAAVFASTADNYTALGLAILVIAYLVYVLVFPEKF